jgi:hypothetical protein
MTEEEREYAAAKEAYLEALERLTRAKAAAPPPHLDAHTYWEQIQSKAAIRNDAIWDRYLAGIRDYGVLAAEFGMSRGWMSKFIRRRRDARQFGPPTARDAGWAQLQMEREFEIWREKEGVMFTTPTKWRHY